MSLFIFVKKGREPERVFCVKHTVLWTVCSKMSLSGSESQLAFDAGKGGESATHAVKTALACISSTAQKSFACTRIFGVSLTF